MTHRFLPTGPLDRQEMLDSIGVGSIDELFACVPEAVRMATPPDVPGPLSDQELRRTFGALAAKNRTPGVDLVSFLGAGAYRHDTPASADHLLARAEFFTVYTPYQPEVSQGTLQAIFEYQTFVSLLTGLPVSNASLYDGASAFAEGVLMAARVAKKRRRVLVSRGVHPQYRETLATYVQNLDYELVEIGWDETGRTDLAALEAALDEEVVAVAVQSPNYFGVVEPWSRVAEPARKVGALVVGAVAEALSLALLESPGAGGCDIAVGEAQSFGIPVSWGGPYLGFLACQDRMKRQMPGRLVGETVDVEGERAFVLTLATREQHIRREKATSNICTNQSLCALLATIYLSLHGRHGLRELALLNLQRAASLRRRLAEVGLEPTFPGSPVFNEFALRAPGGSPGAAWLERLEADGVLLGVPLGTDYPELADSFIVAVTESNGPEELDRAVAAARAGGRDR